MKLVNTAVTAVKLPWN